jgi:sugar lactone lactonase YvrE
LYTVYELPKQLCSFGLLQAEPEDDESSLPLLCAWEDSFQLFDVAQQKALSGMSIGEEVNPAKLPTRLNDGRVDPAGQRYICGGYYGGKKGNKMKVFCVEQRENVLCHTPIANNMEVTNSINWSLDGKTMFLADSPTKQIHAYDYDAGKLSNKRLVHQKSEGVPDGSCVDSEGYLWNAVWMAGEAPGRVQRIDPSTGHVVFTVHMPDTTSQVSCCCFGGENLDILFISTSAEGVDPVKEPHAGGLYAVRVPFTGRKESRLNFTIS